MHKVTLTYQYESTKGDEKTIHTTEIEMGDTDINDMARHLREFLIATTFSAETVDRILLVKGYNHHAGKVIMDPSHLEVANKILVEDLKKALKKKAKK